MAMAWNRPKFMTTSSVSNGPTGLTATAPLPRTSLPTIATVVAIVAALYFGREVFLPLAIALLLTFALASTLWLESWLACALGRQAARLDHSVLYVRVPRPFEDLALALDNRSLHLIRRSIPKKSACKISWEIFSGLMREIDGCTRGIPTVQRARRLFLQSLP
jgi:hypothetical protein